MTVATSIKVRPLSSMLGAEITGIDLREPPDAAVRATLNAAFIAHHMLVIPGQDLDDAAHVRFCEVFGPIQPERTSAHLADRQFPGVHYVANTREDAILPDGDIWFHSDQVFYDTPALATSLYGIDVPRRGGETRFGNIHLAYDALSDEMKHRCDGLRALNAYDYNSPNRLHKVTEERLPDGPRAVHPVIRTHPVTGRKAIYVNRLMTDRIVDLDPAEGKAILETLFDLVEDTHFQYQHRWREGDAIIWDNRSLVHARNTYDHVNDRRTLRRIAVRGDVPY